MSVKVTSEVLSPDDAKVLVGLCRAGKLYEIEKWIASGKSLRTPPQIKKTPLQVAMDLGFHSLIELLVRHEDSRAAKNQALSEAVSRRRLDVVELLLAHGAEAAAPKSKAIMQYLLTLGQPSFVICGLCPCFV
jgi:hypothetical protein